MFFSCFHFVLLLIEVWRPWVPVRSVQACVRTVFQLLIPTIANTGFKISAELFEYNPWFQVYTIFSWPLVKGMPTWDKTQCMMASSIFKSSEIILDSSFCFFLKLLQLLWFFDSSELWQINTGKTTIWIQCGNSVENFQNCSDHLMWICLVSLHIYLVT